MNVIEVVQRRLGSIKGGTNAGLAALKGGGGSKDSGPTQSLARLETGMDKH